VLQGEPSEQKGETVMSEKLRYNLTCHKCFRIHKDFVPLPNKDGVAVVWCRFCKIVLARFDYGTKAYEEDNDS